MNNPGDIAKILFNKYSSSINLSRNLLASSIIASSMMFGGMAQAENVIQTGKDVSIIERTIQLRKVTDRIAAMTEGDMDSMARVSNQLYETAIHESGGLQYNRQMIIKNKKLVAEGRARSVFMIEPETAKNLVDWASGNKKARRLLTRTSGKTMEELAGMSRSQLADFTMQNDTFAAAMARTKYLSVPGKIPDTLEARATYWANYYMAGQKKQIKAAQYVADTKRVSDDIKALRISQALKKHVVATGNTAGLTNKVLHVNKTSSKMGTASSKAMSFIKKLIKR